MSPENYGVFQLLKEQTFRGILAFYNSRKWGYFGVLCHCSAAFFDGSFDRYSPS